MVLDRCFLYAALRQRPFTGITGACYSSYLAHSRLPHSQEDSREPWYYLLIRQQDLGPELGQYIGLQASQSSPFLLKQQTHTVRTSPRYKWHYATLTFPMAPLSAVSFSPINPMSFSLVPHFTIASPS